MDMRNWNVDKTQIAAQQEALKKSMQFTYVGHGPKATGFLSKTFKRKPGLYARCVHAGPYSRTGETYRRMLEAIRERGLSPRDASYETCVLDSMTARSDSEYLTRIDIPVTRR